MKEENNWPGWLFAIGFMMLQMVVVYDFVKEYEERDKRQQKGRG